MHRNVKKHFPLKSAKAESAFTFPAFIVCNMYLTIIARRTNFNPKGKMTRGLKPITVCRFCRRISYLTGSGIWYTQSVCMYKVATEPKF